MAHYRRRYPRHRARTIRANTTHWLNNWPRWHDVVFHTRPRRRDETRIAHAIVSGWLDPDNAAWPLSKRPHHYYW